jgi:hypothetical protein
MLSNGVASILDVGMQMSIKSESCVSIKPMFSWRKALLAWGADAPLHNPGYTTECLIFVILVNYTKFVAKILTLYCSFYLSHS